MDTRGRLPGGYYKPGNGKYFLLAAVLFFSCGKKDRVCELDPEAGSTIVFIGNTFAERLQEHNYFETLLYKSFPDRRLRVRNLAWSADEVNLRPRPMNFGALDEHLRQQKAGIIIAGFGLNEAFDGPDSLDTFAENLKALLSHLQQQRYNDSGTPQVILISPVSHEDLGGFLPDPSAHNRNLKVYVAEMRKIARRLDVPFTDRYEPTAELEEGSDSLTINGIDLDDRGYREVGQMMARALGLPKDTWTGDRHSQRLREAVKKKNQHFFYRFKAQNGEYIYGRRREWAGGKTL